MEEEKEKREEKEKEKREEKGKELRECAKGGDLERVQQIFSQFSISLDLLGPMVSLFSLFLSSFSL